MSLYLLRHGESTANSGEDDCLDAGLSAKGVDQARQVGGRFDLIICSPLARARQTLVRSRITADRVIYEPLCRERIIALRDCLPGEDASAFEPDAAFFVRLERFRLKLSAWQEVFDSVCIVGHAYFFSYLDARLQGMQNAEMRVLHYDRVVQANRSG